jgi:hypothetical protein
MSSNRKSKDPQSSKKDQTIKSFNPETDDLATFLLNTYDSHMSTDKKLHKKNLSDQRTILKKLLTHFSHNPEDLNEDKLSDPCKCLEYHSKIIKYTFLLT